MTHTTEQERAQALAEKHGATSYRNRADTQNPAYGFTPIQLAALIAEVEQAARRAPVVPTRKQIEQYLYEQGSVTVSRDVAEAAGLARLAGKMQSAPAVPVPDVTDAMIEAANEAYCPFGDMHLAIQAALAAAPQPPEAAQSNSAEFDGIKTKAAPVQLPEYDIDTANHAGIRVRGYTQETVRQLLAAHGIKVAP